MQVICKYTLASNKPVLSLPKGAKFLVARAQSDRACLWFLVETDSEEEEQRQFQMVETGEEIDTTGLVYLGTVPIANEQYVWHIFEQIVVKQ